MAMVMKMMMMLLLSPQVLCNNLTCTQNEEEELELKRNNVPNSILNRKQELLKNAVSEQMRGDRGRGSLRIEEGRD